MTPDWLPYLETFAEAAVRASFSVAARGLGITRADAIERVRALERDLGATLLCRTDGRLEPTPFGSKLLDHARRILNLHREVRRDLAIGDAPVTGPLAVAAGSVPGEHLLPELLAAFGRMYPKVRVRAAITGSANAVKQVEQGEVEVGLTGRPPDSPHLDSRRVARDRMVVAVPPEHPLAGHSRVTLENLAAHPVVLREAGSGLRRGFEIILGRAGMSMSDLRVAAEFGGDVAVREAVLRGAGAGVSTTLVVRKDVAAGRLVALRLWGVRCDRDVYAVTDRRRELTPAARLFLAVVGACPVDDPGP